MHLGYIFVRQCETRFKARSKDQVHQSDVDFISRCVNQ